MNTYYDSLHARTADLHFEGASNTKAQILIDAAELSPDRFEIMVLTHSGHELETRFAYSLSEAASCFQDLLQKYTAPKPAPAEPRPLTGKYAKLRDDLRVALDAGRAAQQANPEDGGTCNFDAAALHLPRWSSALINQAAEEAGTHCFKWSFGSGSWVFSPDSGAQANARSRNAEAMTAALRQLGYDAFDYCQMD